KRGPRWRVGLTRRGHAIEIPSLGVGLTAVKFSNLEPWYPSMPPSPPAAEQVTQLPILPPRPADSNKGDFGKVLVVAGSWGMSGAGVLCASAALRGGAGLVRLAVPQAILPIVAAANPCYLTAALAQDADGLVAETAGDYLLALAQANDVAV